MLTVYKNGQEHTGYDNVPVRRRKLSRSKHGHSRYSHHGCAKLSRATTTYEHDGCN